ncbi:MAG: DUF2141 domain-containing protein [Flavobacteriaceae bacterium]|nr:DUF2141 domain-containing protein [Flavobacteriaceae bacterium]
MRRIRVHIIIIASISVLFSFSQVLAQDNNTLHVQVNGAKPDQGQIILSVFNSKNTYMKKSYLGKTETVDAKGRASFEFNELPSGIYAISAFYDEDSDGELKTGFMGIPTEKVAFSNNAKGIFGPPSFNKTSFDVNSDKTITINLVNAKN